MLIHYLESTKTGSAFRGLMRASRTLSNSYFVINVGVTGIAPDRQVGYGQADGVSKERTVVHHMFMDVSSTVHLDIGTCLYSHGYNGR